MSPVEKRFFNINDFKDNKKLKKFSMKESSEELEVIDEGVIATTVLTGLAMGTLLILSPFAFVVGLIAFPIVCFMMKRESKKQSKYIDKVISEISNNSNDKQSNYLPEAKKELKNCIDTNERKILTNFYEPEKTGSTIGNIDPYFTFGFGDKKNKKSNMSIEEGKKRLIIACDISEGLVKRNDIKKIISELNKLDKNIKFGFIENDDFPGDDNGGAWRYFIDAGIISGGPENATDGAHLGEYYKELEEKIKESGLVVVEIYAFMNGVDFINKVNKNSISESYFEDVGDADDNKPESDHPIKDTIMDIDRELTKKSQSTKKAVQDIVNVGRVFTKPFRRTNQWIDNMINQWKDNDENSIKEKLADPRARSGIYQAVKTALLGGSLLKAGLLLNPIFLFLTVTKYWGRDKKIFRIRNEMISELKTELEVIEEKIKDADRLDDRKAKYQLMRFKNEIRKKIIRVGGTKRERNAI
jgi:hypothetical protein